MVDQRIKSEWLLAGLSLPARPSVIIVFADRRHAERTRSQSQPTGLRNPRQTFGSVTASKQRYVRLPTMFRMRRRDFCRRAERTLHQMPASPWGSVQRLKGKPVFNELSPSRVNKARSPGNCAPQRAWPVAVAEAGKRRGSARVARGNLRLVHRRL